MRCLITGAFAILYAYTHSPPTMQLFAASPATSTNDIREDTHAPTSVRRVVLQTHRTTPPKPSQERGAPAAPRGRNPASCVAFLVLTAVLFGRVRSPAPIV